MTSCLQGRFQVAFPVATRSSLSSYYLPRRCGEINELLSGPGYFPMFSTNPRDLMLRKDARGIFRAASASGHKRKPPITSEIPDRGSLERKGRLRLPQDRGSGYKMMI